MQHAKPHLGIWTTNRNWTTGGLDKQAWLVEARSKPILNFDRSRFRTQEISVHIDFNRHYLYVVLTCLFIDRCRLSDKIPFPRQLSLPLSRRSWAGRRRILPRLLVPAQSINIRLNHFACIRLLPALTSISTKLGIGSSPSGHHPVPIAPVALPGLTKNFPSIS